MIKSMDPRSGAGDDSTLIESVTGKLREAIIDGVFPPGTRLVIADLVKRYSVSPMPVREALRRLEGEGMIDSVPNKGATVRRLDSRMIADIYEIRGALEVMVVSGLVNKLTLADLDVLENIQRELEQAVADDDQRGLMEANSRFHAYLGDVGHNREVAKVLGYGGGLLTALRNRYGISKSRREAVVAEHRALLKALRRGDGFEAANIARMHVIAARNDLLALLDKDDQSQP
jgi:DNA-binding GntR family transcriptional regulator